MPKGGELFMICCVKNIRDSIPSIWTERKTNMPLVALAGTVESLYYAVTVNSITAIRQLRPKENVPDRFPSTIN